MARSDLNGNGEWIPEIANENDLGLQNAEDEWITPVQIPESKDKIVDVGNLLDQALLQIVEENAAVEIERSDRSFEDDLNTPSITVLAGDQW
jgi:hypothetical protein